MKKISFLKDLLNPVNWKLVDNCEQKKWVGAYPLETTMDAARDELYYIANLLYSRAFTENECPCCKTKVTRKYGLSEEKHTDSCILREIATYGYPNIK